MKLMLVPDEIADGGEFSFPYLRLGDVATKALLRGDPLGASLGARPGDAVAKRHFSEAGQPRRPRVGLLFVLVSRSIRTPRTPQDLGAGGPEATRGNTQRPPVELLLSKSCCMPTAVSCGAADAPSSLERRGSRTPEPELGRSKGEVSASLSTCGTVLGEPPRDEPRNI